MIGKIKFYNNEKKFGFIKVDGNGDDFFFHYKQVSDRDVKCLKGEIVEFDAVESKRKDGSYEANNVRHAAGYKESSLKIRGRPSDALFNWAFIPFYDIKREDGPNLEGCLESLRNMSLDEEWAWSRRAKRLGRYPLLANYLQYTFFKLYKDGLIREESNKGENWAAFNTGLVNDLYEPIFALFEPSKGGRTPWYFKAFCAANYGRDGQILARNFNPLPEPPRYFHDVRQVIFDPDIDIAPRYDHMMFDGIARGRFPKEFLEEHCPKGLEWQDYEAMPKDEKDGYLNRYSELLQTDHKAARSIKNRLDDAIELAVKRARWNFKTAIPIYFPKRNEISLLLPLALVNDEEVDLALVISRTAAGGYSGETVYKLSWAYSHARLVCRPDSDWLVPEAAKPDDGSENDVVDEADDEVEIDEDEDEDEEFDV